MSTLNHFNWSCLFRWAFALGLLGIMVFPMQAQTFKAYMKAADKSYKSKDYYSALEYYRRAEEMKPGRLDLAYRVAEVARAYFAYDIAETNYKKVLYSPQKAEFPLVGFWLAQVKKSKGEYVEARAVFRQFLEERSVKDDYYGQLAKAEIATCDWAIAQIEDPDPVEITQLNKRVNTGYSEFAPYQKGDTLYYSSYRFKNREDDHQPSREIAKVLLTTQGRKGKPLTRGFNERARHTAHTAFSSDGRKIYYTICDYNGTTAIQCAIYYREKDRRKRWGKAKKLPKSINGEGSTATHPHIGLDSLTGKETLYFVSDRSGGQGGLDIWSAPLDKKGKPGKVQNLSAINTEGDEASPFYHAASRTLFFSSTGHPGLGGYDIFKSLQKMEGWGEAEHTGYPMNSSFNDLYFWLNSDSTQAYLSSNRTGSFYLDKDNKSCCNDIYRAMIYPDTTDIPSIVPEDSLTIVFEEPPNPETEEPEVSENVIPPPPPVPTSLEGFLPLALYFDNDEPDKRTRRTTTKKSYEETYNRYYRRKSQYLSAYANPLSGDERVEAELALETFFEREVRKGYEFLFRFSEILLNKLNQGEKVEIFVKGFTSPRAKSDYNLYLGKRRVSSVRNHFKTYAGGIFKTFLQSGQLIISEKSFGETTAASGISDDLDDQRNSIYSVGAAKERRVEIVEIKRGE
ncbi:MAG: hypothetical protein AAFP19_11570 [Bacteroidota bacterium]